MPESLEEVERGNRSPASGPRPPGLRRQEGREPRGGVRSGSAMRTGAVRSPVCVSQLRGRDEAHGPAHAVGTRPASRDPSLASAPRRPSKCSVTRSKGPACAWGTEPPQLSGRSRSFTGTWDDGLQAAMRFPREGKPSEKDTSEQGRPGTQDGDPCADGQLDTGLLEQ